MKKNCQKVLIIRKADFFGGAEVYSLNLATGLKKNNLDAVIWTNNDKLIDQAKYLGIGAKKRWLGPPVKNKKLFFLFVVLYPLLFVYYFIVLLILKLKKEVTVLHLKSLNDFLLFTFIGKLLCLKIFWSVDVAFYPKNNKILKWWFVLTSRAADRIIALSEFMKRNIAGNGVNPDKISLVYNGIDEKYFAPFSAISSEGVVKVGFAGKVSEEKGILIFLEAAKKVLERTREVEFWVVGNASSNFYEKECGEEKIIFKGWRDDLSKIYAELDIVVAPSLVEESFGLVAAEAMARGKALIVSDRGALPELVEDKKSGIIVPFGNSDILADVLFDLVQDRKKILDLGKNARYRAEKLFSLEKIAKEVIDLYGFN